MMNLRGSRLMKEKIVSIFLMPYKCCGNVNKITALLHFEERRGCSGT